MNNNSLVRKDKAKAGSSVTSELSVTSDESTMRGKGGSAPVALKPTAYQCEICSRYLSSRILLEGHMRAHNNDAEFTCHLCQKAFTLLIYLQQHMKYHTDKRPYKCKLCSQTYKHNCSLKRHMVMAHFPEKKAVKCGICAKAFYDNERLKQHERIHTGEKPYVCGDCGARFAHSGGIHCHRVSHSSDYSHFCPECGRSFLSNSRLKIHMRIHLPEKPYKCPECPNRYTTRSKCTQHINVHRNTYQCQICKSAFPTEYELNKHIKTHNRPRNFSCDQCGELFMWKSAFTTHMDQTHLAIPVKTIVKSQSHKLSEAVLDSVADKVREDDCKKFNKMRKRENNLKNAATNVGIGPSTSEGSLTSPQESNQLTNKSPVPGASEKYKCKNKGINVKMNEEDDYDYLLEDKPSPALTSNVKSSDLVLSCTVCGKSFSKKYKLRRHIMRVHMDDKPFQCAYCPKRYSLISSLERHINVHKHTYQCHICDKAYRTEYELNNHVEIHRNEGRFKCNQCGKAFALKRYLMRHIKSLHSSGTTGMIEELAPAKSLLQTASTVGPGTKYNGVDVPFGVGDNCSNMMERDNQICDENLIPETNADECGVSTGIKLEYVGEDGEVQDYIKVEYDSDYQNDTVDQQSHIMEVTSRVVKNEIGSDDNILDVSNALPVQLEFKKEISSCDNIADADNALPVKSEVKKEIGSCDNMTDAYNALLVKIECFDD